MGQSLPQTLQISISTLPQPLENNQEHCSLQFLSYSKSTSNSVPLLIFNISSKELCIDCAQSDEEVLNEGAVSMLPASGKRSAYRDVCSLAESEWFGSDHSHYNGESLVKVQALYRRLALKKFLHVLVDAAKINALIHKLASRRIVKALTTWVQARAKKLAEKSKSAAAIQRWYRRLLAKPKDQPLKQLKDETKANYITKNYSSTRITSFKQTPKNVPNEIDNKILSAIERDADEVASDQYSDYCIDTNEYLSNEPHSINSVGFCCTCRGKCLEPKACWNW
eukprot:TRINITY_DN7388_c0_g1_i3.p1 TRINITY_DN7388_c0_g1~~TRINITY_DN7388_c0_g1_i3.p1  ORF type:complete len:281 (-),score=31.94 TRINITY_DN7388_c0_g1_i3:634-1476(-)